MAVSLDNPSPQIPNGWTFTDADRALAAELQERLPPRIFDVHMHPYRVQDIGPRSNVVSWGPDTAGLDVWRQFVGLQLGESRLVGALCTPMPSREGDVDAVNDFAAAEVANEENFRANIVVSPAYPREQVEARLANPKVVGLKPYHFYAEREDTFQSDIEEFLPEWLWEIANERGLVILLHMVKHGALADPENQASIRRLCEQHPNVRLILAHAARGFHAPNTTKNIAALRGLENVWFDMSAVCEAEPMAAILREFGPRRLMFGTDFHVSQQRGRCVTLGTGFAWIVTDQVAWNERAFFGEPVLVGLESTRALLGAADQVGLSSEDLQDVFCDNAQRLLGLVPAPGDATQKLYTRGKRAIPGGTQLLRRRKNHPFT